MELSGPHRSLCGICMCVCVWVCLTTRSCFEAIGNMSRHSDFFYSEFSKHGILKRLGRGAGAARHETSRTMKSFVMFVTWKDEYAV